MDALDIGSRLKILRETSGISQRRLAAAARVTSGFISQVEQNKTSPSVATLHRILDVMSFSMVDFFSIEVGEDPKPKVFYRGNEMREIIPSVPDEAGNPIPQIVMRGIGRASENSLLMMHETYLPGADTGGIPYTHEGEEAGYILSGALEVTVDGEITVLGAGDGYVFDSSLPHRFRNIDDVPCMLVSATATQKRKEPK